MGKRTQSCWMFQYFKRCQKSGCLSKMSQTLNVGYCSMYLHKAPGEAKITHVQAEDRATSSHMFSSWPYDFPLFLSLLVLNCPVTSLTAGLIFLSFPIIIPFVGNHFILNILSLLFSGASSSCLRFQLVAQMLWDRIRDGYLQSRRK